MFEKSLVILNPGLRHKICVIGFLIIAVTVLFVPVIMGWQGIFHDDQAMEEFPRYYFLAHNLQRGIIPLWDPQTWCGAIPFYARYYTDTYYLPLWPFYFLANLNNLNQAYWLLILLPLWLHYILAAIGMFMLLRRLLKCGYIASCFGALAYIYSPAFTYAYVWQQVISVQTWLPWLIIIYVSVVEQWRFWKLLLAGFIFAFILTAGVPSYWPFVAFIWGSVIILLMIARLRMKKKMIMVFTPLSVAFLIIVIGAGLSSIYLCPWFDGRQYTQEHIKLTTESALDDPFGSLPPLYLATLFVPNLFGNITGINMPSFNPGHSVLYWEANMSGGMAVSLLALLGLVLVFIMPLDNKSQQRQWQRIRRLCALAAIIIYLFAVLCVLGRHTPFYKYVIGCLPGIGQLPRPIRYRMLQCFAVSIMTAFGIEYFKLIKKSEYLQIRYHLRFWVLCYIIASLFVVGLAVSWPVVTRDEFAYQWFGKPGAEVDGYCISGEAAGNYSPPTLTKKIGVFFDAESSGEIRSANSHENIAVNEGIFLNNYYVPNKGWYEFDVNIPANQFVWIYQKSGKARIGYKNFRDFPYRGYVYSNRWDEHTDVNVICFYQQLHRKVNSMVAKLKSKDIHSGPILISIFYWVFASLLFILAVYYLSPHRLGYLLGIIASVEFFTFGLLAFYGGTYAFDIPFPSHVRALRPSSHPMLQRALGSLAKITADSTLRIATTEPFHDNFLRIADRFALMGYEMHPLEIRFKQAIETAYGQPIDFFIYYTEPRPQPNYRAFLNNFSVGYLMSISSSKVFLNENIFSLPEDSKIFANINPNYPPVASFSDYFLNNFSVGYLMSSSSKVSSYGPTVSPTSESGFFVHTNPSALPRAFTMDKVVIASETEQLTQLVSGDLHKAVYVRPEDSFTSQGALGEIDIRSYFADLQRTNPIPYLNFDNPNRIDIDVEITKPAMLVLTELWYPGWEASVDGKRVKVYRVNYCQRGVWLEKGIHKVRFVFRPLAWEWGLKISLWTITIMLLLTIVEIIQKRYYISTA